MNYNSNQLLYTFYDQSHILGGIHFSVAVAVYMHIDINLEIFDELNQKKDLKVMKIVHDLKNPTIAILQSVNDIDIEDINELRNIVNQEIEDMQDMLDNLRAEFKSSQKMNMNEESREVLTKEFLRSIKRTHQRLAKNGKNTLKFETSESFPEKITIQRINTKRVINNIISNALKHTTKGYVHIIISIFDQNQEKKYLNYVHVGCNLNKESQQMVVQVSDNGSGIPSKKLTQIFDEKESDESAANWDGTGLGLPICKQIIHKLNGCIKQHSVEGEYTIFRIQIPIQINQVSRVIKRFSTQTNNSNSSENNFEHDCKTVLIAEDNPNIINKYTKSLEKHQIPNLGFLNGQALYEQLQKIRDCPRCKKILVFTDMSMPYKNGIELAKDIRDLKNSIIFKIILISAEEQSNNDGLFDMIQNKPIQPKSLVSEQQEFQKDDSFIFED